MTKKYIEMVHHMEAFAEYLERIENPQHRVRMEDVLGWVMKKFPNLAPVIKWNQPMFTDHGTYIIGFSTAKNHMAVAPERSAIHRFSKDIEQAGYDHSKELVRIPWDRPMSFPLLEKLIRFNTVDKADCKTFWRKA